MGLLSVLLKWAVVVAALLVAVLVLTVAAIADLAPAPAAVRKAGCMPISLAAALLLLALLFLVWSAVPRNAFPLWPALLCVILERAIALGWR